MPLTIHAARIDGIDFVAVGSWLIPREKLGSLSIRDSFVVVHVIGVGDVVTTVAKADYDAFVSSGKKL